MGTLHFLPLLGVPIANEDDAPEQRLEIDEPLVLGWQLPHACVVSFIRQLEARAARWAPQID